MAAFVIGILIKIKGIWKGVLRLFNVFFKGCLNHKSPGGQFSTVRLKAERQGDYTRTNTARLCAHNNKEIMLATDDDNALKFKGQTLPFEQWIIEGFGIMGGKKIFQSLSFLNWLISIVSKPIKAVVVVVVIFVVFVK